MTTPTPDRTDVLLERARRVMPGGSSHNIRAFPPRPLVVARAEGAYVHDADGRRYADYWQSHNAAILGHAHPDVVAGIRRALEKGVHFGAIHEGEIELAERLTRLVPSVERLRFTTSGSESTMYAIRLARAYTGRSLVAKAFGAWHGGNESLIHSVSREGAETAGLLAESAQQVVTYRYNDVEATQALLRRHRGQLACVIVEPILGDGGGIRASREFLRMLRDEATDGGFLLVFDEIVTGFRFRLGGVQDEVGVKPDMTTLGKIIGGELPIGAYGGREDIMRLATPGPAGARCWTGGGTFSSHHLAMAAGLATLDHLESHPAIYERLEKLARWTAHGVDEAFAAQGIRTRTIATGSLLNTVFPTQDGPLECAEDMRARTDRDARTRYRTLLLEEGVFLLPTHGCGAMSAAHGQEEASALVDASARIARTMARAPR